MGRTITVYRTLRLQNGKMYTVLYPFLGISISIHGDWGSQSEKVDLSDRLVGRAIPICMTLCSQNGSVCCAILMNRNIYSHSWRLGFPKWNLKVDNVCQTCEREELLPLYVHRMGVPQPRNGTVQPVYRIAGSFCGVQISSFLFSVYQNENFTHETYTMMGLFSWVE